jgi:hypothetical protein
MTEEHEMQWVQYHKSFFRFDVPFECPLLGEPVTLTIHTEQDEIQSEQLQALEGFLQIPVEGRADLLGPLHAEHNRVYDIIGKGPTPSGTPEQVWKFVRWKEILIPEQGPRGCRFVFVRGEPFWYRDHGVELCFRNEKLVHLGPNSGAFLSDCFWDWE